MNEFAGLDNQEREVIARIISLVYDFLKTDSKADDIDALNFVRKNQPAPDLDRWGPLEIYVVEEGAVYVAFNFIKENPDKDKKHALKYILKNYRDLLDKYYDEGR